MPMTLWIQRCLRQLCVPLGLSLAGLLFSTLGYAQSVVFINPGFTGEAYWMAAEAAMHKAADSLGMQLQVIRTERDRFKPIEVAQQLAQLPQAQRPQYLIFSNDYSVAPRVLQALQGSGIQVFMAFSGIQPELRAQVGLPRQTYPWWIGSLEPNAQKAGYLTAKALIDAALQRPHLQDAQGQIQLLAIAGDRSTSSSIARNRGMRQAVAEAGGRVRLMQEVYGEWRMDKAKEQAQVLYQRYPQARLVWSGNDLMAFGAMQAWQAQGGRPGEDALFSGINTSAQAFEQLRSGQLHALAGGHFLAGAWAMVMLFDHHHGVDFATEGLELQQPMFVLFDVDSSLRFERKLGDNARSPLNFRIFSKHLNPKVQRYQFDLGQLLR